MKAAYSVKELQKMGLSGLPSSVSQVSRVADREQWPFFWETVRGGSRKMYLSELLPDPVRQALLDKEEINFLVPADRRHLPPAGGQPVSRDQEKQAGQKADLLRLYMQALAGAAWGQKTQARDDFMRAYNSGLAYPDLFAALGELSWQTIEGWKRKLKKTGGDTLQLADRRGRHRKGRRGLNQIQTDILLRCALHPNKPRIAEAIRMAHAVMNAKQIENGLSEATYRRWLQDWIERNYHIWIFNREGAKAWNDKCAFYIERDYSLINVGDILVADGHTLNFEVINPWTGKPKRMTLILFLDMKSSMPLGWEIMPTEDTAAISSALRRAIIALGKMPKVIYLDNGRAFKSRFFQGAADFEEAGFAGLYERLGIKTIFAWPYHGQSKTVERFFGTFAELERWCPSYSGTSIEHKPPRMMRGEKIHRQLYEKTTGGRVLTLEAAHRAIAAWFDIYAKRPQRGHLEGAAPLDLFAEERGPGVDKAALSYLMMSLEIKHINRNGISFQGRNYYAPALYGRRHPVVIRYDLQDKSALYVFETDGEFICQAEMVDRVHPAANVLGSEEDKQRLVTHIEQKKRQEKEASGLARTMLEDEILPQHQQQLARAGITLEGPQAARQLPAPVVKLDEKKLARDAAELDRSTREAEAEALDNTLEELEDPARYELLLERSYQGLEVSKRWQNWMSYYEETPEYLKDLDFWNDRRTAYTMMYQAETR
jgi:putative transposase